jgi:hypothetical protein
VVPAKWVSERVATTSGTLKPFVAQSTGGDRASPTQPASILPDDFDGPELEEENAMYPASRKFNELAYQCDQLEWVPTTDAEFKKVLGFFEQVVDLRNSIEEARLPFSDLDILEQQIEYWEARFATALGNPLKDSVNVFHKMSLPKLQYNSEVRSLVIVDVIQAASAGGQTIYVKAVGNDMFFRLPVDSERYVMPSGGRWLLVLNRIATKPQVATLNPRSEYQTISCRDASVVASLKIFDK